MATLGASNHTFSCATARQTTADWIGAQVRALEFFGGVPRLIAFSAVHAPVPCSALERPGHSLNTRSPSADRDTEGGPLLERPCKPAMPPDLIHA